MAIEIGYTDQVNTCDCCGKQPLKHTVAIRDTETCEELFLGSVCAGRYTGFRMTGNPWRALERLTSHARTSGVTFEDIQSGIAEHQAERDA